MDLTAYSWTGCAIRVGEEESIFGDRLESLGVPRTPGTGTHATTSNRKVSRRSEARGVTMHT